MSLDKAVLEQAIKDLRNIDTSSGSIENDDLAAALANAIAEYVPQEGGYFKGVFVSLTALTAGVPSPVEGDYAYVDAGVGVDIVAYLWDTNEGWVVSSGTSSNPETPESIKTKYELNSNTNAFTDLDKSNIVTNTAKISNVDHPLVETAVPAGAVFTDTETNTSLAINANILTYTDELGSTTNIDLNLYLDDTNLAQIVSGTLDGNTGIATFTRNDASSFTVDMSALLDDTSVTVNNTLTSLSTTEALSAAQGKVLKDVQDTQANDISTNNAKVTNVDHPLVQTAVPLGAVFTDTVYTHPTYNGDDASVDTGALTGAVVISDLDFNVATDTLGHVIDVNATAATRTLTSANIGAVPLVGGAVISGNKEFYSTDITGSYTQAAIEIREVNLVTNTESVAAYAPAIAFHWGAHTQGRLALHSDGIFHVTDGTTHTTYKSMQAASFIGDLAGTADDSDLLGGLSSAAFGKLADNNSWSGINVFKRPTDFWSNNFSHWDIAGYGAIATQGSFGVSMIWNGYRNSAGGSTIKGVNGFTEMAELSLNASGLQFDMGSDTAAIGQNAKFTVSNVGAVWSASNINSGGGISLEGELDYNGGGHFFLDSFGTIAGASHLFLRARNSAGAIKQGLAVYNGTNVYGAVQYNNSNKVHATASGITATGDITVTGLVDGRDVAADGTTLDALAAATQSFDGLSGKLDGTGDYATTGELTAGRNSGSVSLAINDGYGNASVAFNHLNGIPDVSGSSARIETSVDGTLASFNFELGDSVTAGVALSLQNIMRMRTADIISYKNHQFSAGIAVTGNVTVTGLVDGRDVAADGAALDALGTGGAASVGVSLQGNGTSNPTVLQSTGVISVIRTGVGQYQVSTSGSLSGYLSTGTSFGGGLKVVKGNPILIETYNAPHLGDLYDIQSSDVLDISIRP